MNKPKLGNCFLIVETGDGHRTSCNVDYFMHDGVRLVDSPDQLLHNATVTVAFDYFLDHHLQMIKTHALVSRHQHKGITLQFHVGSMALDIAKRLSRTQRVVDGMQLFDEEIIAAAVQH